MGDLDHLFQPAPPGGAPLCECPSVAAVLEAELNGGERHLCPQHDADKINARQAEKDRAVLERELALGYAVQERIRQEQAEARAVKAKAERDAAEEEALADLDPLVADLHRLTGASVIPIGAAPSARDQIAIGDDDAFVRILTDLVGGTVNPTDPQGPTAA